MQLPDTVDTQSAKSLSIHNHPREYRKRRFHN